MKVAMSFAALELDVLDRQVIEPRAKHHVAGVILDGLHRRSAGAGDLDVDVPTGNHAPGIVHQAPDIGDLRQRYAVDVQAVNAIPFMKLKLRCVVLKRLAGRTCCPSPGGLQDHLWPRWAAAILDPA
jgi:hypothetical protein